ncbi:MAG: HEAT repeat domain-containing protein [Candidatus Desulfacyla sp.]
MNRTGADSSRIGGRRLKTRVRDILTSMEMEQGLDALYQMPARRLINPLFSFLYAGDDRLRWRAITAMGRVVARLADEDREAARVVMRRLMWNLNDESGGIGWGSPEAMGEILACHEGLAEEFASILISYARADGNYLEYEMLQRGLLWGIARLARARPHLIRDSVLHLIPYLESKDPAIRGMAAYILGLLEAREARRPLVLLREDEATFQTWADTRLVNRQVCEMAKGALDRLSAAEDDDSKRKGR